MIYKQLYWVYEIEVIVFYKVYEHFYHTLLSLDEIKTLKCSLIKYMLKFLSKIMQFQNKSLKYFTKRSIKEMSIFLKKICTLNEIISSLIINRNK